MAPDIDYDEWKQIEHDMNECRSKVTRYMMQGFMASTGNPDPRCTEIFMNDIAQLDNAVREEMAKVDLDELKKHLPKDSQDFKTINNLFNKLLGLKKEKENEGKGT